MTRRDELLQMIAGARDECVLWPYAKSKGYGRVFAAGETRRAHVVVCEFAHGAKPIGCEVAHSCGERSCVNPRHLRWATAAENSADRIAHGRQTRRLSVEQVREIRQLGPSMKQRDIAKRFGIKHSTVGQILRGITWRHVPQDRPASAA